MVDGFIGDFDVEGFFEVERQPDPAEPPEPKVVGEAGSAGKAGAGYVGGLFDRHDHLLEDDVIRTVLHDISLRLVTDHEPAGERVL